MVAKRKTPHQLLRAATYFQFQGRRWSAFYQRNRTPKALLVASCGSRYWPVHEGGQGLLLSLNAQAFVLQHSACVACRIAEGRSKAKRVRANHDVEHLFAQHIYDVRGSSFRSEDGQLYHNGQLEYLWLNDGALVHNSEPGSCGGSSCAEVPYVSQYVLPLITLGYNFSVGQMRGLRILECKAGAVLLRVGAFTILAVDPVHAGTITFVLRSHPKTIREALRAIVPYSATRRGRATYRLGPYLLVRARVPWRLARKLKKSSGNYARTERGRSGDFTAPHVTYYKGALLMNGARITWRARYRITCRPQNKDAWYYVLAPRATRTYWSVYGSRRNGNLIYEVTQPRGKED